MALEMADCCVDVLAMIDAFHMDSRASAVRATSVAFPVIEHIGGRSVIIPLSTLCFSPLCISHSALCEVKIENQNQLSAPRRLSP